MKNPPKKLGTPGRALWRSIAAWAESQNFEFDQHELVILVEACGVVDRLAQVAEALEGLQTDDPVALRLLVEERQQRALLASLLTTRLGLPTGLAVVGSTPRSRRAQTAARARWDNAS